MFRDHEFCNNLHRNMNLITSFYSLENLIVSWKNSRAEVRGAGADKVVKN